MGTVSTSKFYNYRINPFHFAIGPKTFFLEERPPKIIKYRKIANQYGVCKFVRIDGN